MEKLDKKLQNQFKKILARHLEGPHVVAAKLSGSLKHCYKIKLRNSGYRFVYQVNDGKMIVLVVAIAKRDKDQIYIFAADRNTKG